LNNQLENNAGFARFPAVQSGKAAFGMMGQGGEGVGILNLEIRKAGSVGKSGDKSRAVQTLRDCHAFIEFEQPTGQSCRICTVSRNPISPRVGKG
jgi:hypothetical protein